ncbi:MAG: alpha/beta hydrolase [Candidatus Dormibacteria bacterium]
MAASTGPLEVREGTFTAVDGLELYYVSRRAPGVTPRRLVITVHGFADHSGRIPYLVDHLARRGAVVYSFDQRGNGRSPGRRGHIDNYGQLLADLDAFVALATAAEPGLERILFGHSTGGILTMTFAAGQMGRIDRMILSAPALILAFRAPAWKDALARLMASLVPTLTMQAGFPPEWVCRDAEVVRANKADPLVVQDMSSRFYSEVYLKAAPAALASASQLTVPLLILQGEADRLVNPSVATEVAARTTAPHVVHKYEAAYHETFNDTCREEVFRDIDAWLEAPDS